jgi:protein Shroom
LNFYITFPCVQQLCLERREKLCEQLEEARKLRQSIFRRAELVFRILGKHLPDQTLHTFGGFVKEKIRLILETRQHADTLKLEEDILKCLKEYSTGVMII